MLYYKECTSWTKSNYNINIQDLYVSFKSGLRKTKTRIIQGVTPNFNQVLQLELDNMYLTVKVKDAGLYTCFGGFCTPFNSLIADT